MLFSIDQITSFSVNFLSLSINTVVLFPYRFHFLNESVKKSICHMLCHFFVSPKKLYDSCIICNPSLILSIPLISMLSTDLFPKLSLFLKYSTSFTCCKVNLSFHLSLYFPVPFSFKTYLSRPYTAICIIGLSIF